MQDTIKIIACEFDKSGITEKKDKETGQVVQKPWKKYGVGYVGKDGVLKKAGCFEELIPGASYTCRIDDYDGEYGKSLTIKFPKVVDGTIPEKPDTPFDQEPPRGEPPSTAKIHYLPTLKTASPPSAGMTKEDWERKDDLSARQTATKSASEIIAAGIQCGMFKDLDDIGKNFDLIRSECYKWLRGTK